MTSLYLIQPVIGSRRGVPVIAGTAGGLGEIVENGLTGLLFANNDTEALLNCPRAIVSGSAFSRHTLPGEVVRKSEVIISPEDYIGRMRHVFSEIAEPAPLLPQ